MIHKSVLASNMEVIQAFLTSFNKITGAHIGIHDPEYAIEYASGGVDGNLCDFCKKRCDAFLNNCYCDDALHLSIAISSRQTHVFRCHLGVMSVIIPIFHNEQICGVIDFGMIRLHPDDTMEFPAVFKRLCTEYPDHFTNEDHDAILEAYRKTAVMDEETLQQYTTLVTAAVRGLLLSQLFLKPMSKSEDRLRRYIELLNPEHIPLSAVKVSDIASALNFSYSHIIRLSQAVYGMPIKQYILKRKIEYAASRLIEDPNLRVRDAAWIVGIEDPQYFSRLFRNQMGCSCSEYREQLQKISGEKEDR